MTSRRFGPYTVEFANEDKVFFPGSGITKGNVIHYYVATAGVLLAHVRERPVVLHRFPDGIESEGFYHKEVPDYFPDWLETVTVRKGRDERQKLVVANNAAALAYLANQGTITFHAWLCRRDRVNVPDVMVFDMDPGESQDFEAVRRAAERCRELLDDIGARSFVKTTGSSGVHVAVPLDRDEDFDQVRAVARAATRVLVDRYPEELTVEQRKDRRGGRLFVDAGRNAYAQTWAAPYVVRPLPGAPVSMPIEWEELLHGDVKARTFTVHTARERLRSQEDVWASIRRHAVSLKTIQDGLAALRSS